MSAYTRALYFAEGAHAAQKRRYTGEPYIQHPIEVAYILRAHGVVDDTSQQVALLHDTLEDCEGVTEELLRRLFPDPVVEAVVELTDVFTATNYRGFPREKRKMLERLRLGEAGEVAQTVKVADCISNARSILAHDPNFARVYLREMRLLLPYLTLAPASLRDELQVFLDVAPIGA